MPQSKTLHGQPVSPGIALGPAYSLHRNPRTVRRLSVSEEVVDRELAALDRALESARSDFLRQMEQARERFGEMVAKIFEAHLLILEDQATFDMVREEIRRDRVNAASVLWETLETFARGFDQQDEAYFRDRAQDVRDVRDRLLAYLLGEEAQKQPLLSQPSVLVASALSPGDVLLLDTDLVLAVACDTGGRTSHTAILTRSLGVPSVVGLKDISERVREGITLAVNGNSGKVIVDPDADQREKYRRKEAQYRAFVSSLQDIREAPAETGDGHHVELQCNIELPGEAKRVIAAGSDGVGLYRTEYMVLTAGHLPDEEAQYTEYKQVLELLEGRPMIIRTFDLGGDKAFPGAGIPEQSNPFLGYRAIRVGLDRPEMLVPQLRAILRAAVHGPVKIMFPMIASLEELRALQKLMADVKDDLASEGIEYGRHVPVGIMVEVPSTALQADLFAKQVDFFSIGTNDLVQFTLAVDRSNEWVADLHNPFHPAVLQLVQKTVQAAKRQGIPVGMCGEFAGHPLATLLLVGLGLDELSMSPAQVPETKKLILASRFSECEELANSCLHLEDASTVEAKLLEFMKERFRDLPIWFSSK